MQLLLFTLIFLLASLLMIFSTERMAARGLEGTAIGTLILPYCSGAPNLIFVVVLFLNSGNQSDAMVNATVNNMTNLTLLLAVPALFWGLNVLPKKKVPKKQVTEYRLNRLSLLLTLLAGIFFTGVLYACGRDGVLDLYDGIILVSIFIFWQVVEFFGVMKISLTQKRKISPLVILDFVLLAIGTALVFYSVDTIVNIISAIPEGFISVKHLGWLSGWLMVLPNAVPAIYYSIKDRSDIVYSSQTGDGHICIPLAVGLAAILCPFEVTAEMLSPLAILCGLFIFHIFFVSILGRLPKIAAAILIVIYGYFLYHGLM